MPFFIFAAPIIGFLQLLTLVLAGAKLFVSYPISWLWVFSPLWLPVAFASACAVLAVGILWSRDIYNNRKSREVRRKQGNVRKVVA